MGNFSLTCLHYSTIPYLSCRIFNNLIHTSHPYYEILSYYSIFSSFIIYHPSFSHFLCVYLVNLHPYYSTHFPAAAVACAAEQDVVARYHRQLARMRVTVVWREFRRRQSLLQGALGNLQVPPGGGFHREKARGKIGEKSQGCGMFVWKVWI